jgi:hypothetical protein
VQRDHGVGLHTRVVGAEHQVFDGLLVVQDHLRFQRILAFGSLAERDQPLGVQAAVGVALQLRRGPRQVDQQAVEHVPGESARGGLRGGRAAHGVQLLAQVLRKVGRVVRLVLLQERWLVSHWAALVARLGDVGANLSPSRGHGHVIGRRGCAPSGFGLLCADGGG